MDKWLERTFLGAEHVCLLAFSRVSKRGHLELVDFPNEFFLGSSNTGSGVSNLSADGAGKPMPSEDWILAKPEVPMQTQRTRWTGITIVGQPEMRRAFTRQDKNLGRVLNQLQPCTIPFVEGAWKIGRLP